MKTDKKIIERSKILYILNDSTQKKNTIYSVIKPATIHSQFQSELMHHLNINECSFKQKKLDSHPKSEIQVIINFIFGWKYLQNGLQ